MGQERVQEAKSLHVGPYSSPTPEHTKALLAVPQESEERQAAGPIRA